MKNDETEITIKQLYDEIVRNRRELKNSVEASEARILLKVESMNDKLKKLEKENTELKNKVEILDRDSRKKNLIIFSLNRNSREVSLSYICTEIKKLLTVNITESDISNIYPLGNADNTPIKLELVSQLKKKEILQNCSKLKYSKVFIAHDLTEKQRSENKILKTYLNQARERTNDRSYIKGNRLIVNDIAYTVDDLQNEEETTKHNSAPPTPNNYPNRSLEIEKDAQEPIIWKPRTNAEDKQTKSGIGEEEKILSDLEELHNTTKTGTIKKSTKQTAVPLNKEAVRNRLRSNK